MSLLLATSGDIANGGSPYEYYKISNISLSARTFDIVIANYLTGELKTHSLDITGLNPGVTPSAAWSIIISKNGNFMTITERQPDSTYKSYVLDVRGGLENFSLIHIFSNNSVITGISPNGRRVVLVEGVYPGVIKVFDTATFLQIASINVNFYSTYNPRGAVYTSSGAMYFTTASADEGGLWIEDEITGVFTSYRHDYSGGNMEYSLIDYDKTFVIYSGSSGSENSYAYAYGKLFSPITTSSYSNIPTSQMTHVMINPNYKNDGNLYTIGRRFSGETVLGIGIYDKNTNSIVFSVNGSTLYPLGFLMTGEAVYYNTTGTLLTIIDTTNFSDVTSKFLISGANAISFSLTNKFNPAGSEVFYTTL